MLPHISTRLNQAMREILSWLTFFVWTLQKIQIVARHNPWHLHHGHHMLKDHTKGFGTSWFGSRATDILIQSFQHRKGSKDWMNNEWSRCALLRTAERHISRRYFIQISPHFGPSPVIHIASRRPQPLHRSLMLKVSKIQIHHGQDMTGHTKNIKKRIECRTTCTLRKFHIIIENGHVYWISQSNFVIFHVFFCMYVSQSVHTYTIYGKTSGLWMGHALSAALAQASTSERKMQNFCWTQMIWWIWCNWSNWYNYMIVTLLRGASGKPVLNPYSWEFHLKRCRNLSPWSF